MDGVLSWTSLTSQFAMSKKGPAAAVDEDMALASKL